MAANNLENLFGTKHKSFIIGKSFPEYGPPVFGPTLFQGPNAPVPSDSIANAINSGDLWIQTGASPALYQFSANSWMSVSSGSGGGGSSLVTLVGSVTGSGSTGTNITTTLSTTGVTAGVYGDGTNIPSFTVGADGRISNITTNAITTFGPSTATSGGSDGLVPRPGDPNVENYILFADANWRDPLTSIPGFLGATAATNGNSGLVPIPLNGQQNYVLFGNATWADPVADMPIFTGATGSTPGTNGFVPAPASGMEHYILFGDGTWENPIDTIPVYGGAIPAFAGTPGLVPAPSAGQQNDVLVGGGSWVGITTILPSLVGATVATSGSAGLVPQPNFGQQNYVLFGNATWADPVADMPIFTGATAGTPGVAGFVPAPASGYEDAGLVGDGTFDLTDRLVHISLADFPTGGSIGAAATTVDVAGAIIINQLTANQVLTIPSPSVGSNVRRIKIINIGSVPFVIGGSTFVPTSVSTNTAVEFIWSGNSWCLPSSVPEYQSFSYSNGITVTQSIVDLPTGTVVQMVAPTAANGMTVLVPAPSNITIPKRLAFFNTSNTASCFLCNTVTSAPFAYISELSTTEIVWDNNNYNWRSLSPVTLTYQANAATQTLLPFPFAQNLVFTTLVVNDGFGNNIGSPVIPMNGFYSINLGLIGGTTTASGSYFLATILKNGTVIFQQDYVNNVPRYLGGCAVSSIQYCNAGDVITAQFTQGTGLAYQIANLQLSITLVRSVNQ